MQKKTLLAEELVHIFDEHYALLLLFARQWNSSNAEDVVQTAFMRLIKYVYEKGRPENMVAWLFTAIRNEANNQKRNRNRRNHYEEEFAKERKVWFVPIETTTLEVQEMMDSLEQLPIELWEIVIMRIWGELSFDEIADSTQQPRTTVWRRYNEALDILRKSLF
ncbi:MAG: sigma-70 family RNA polymerase sigma factor [Planctomycetia bacterium]|nr:sigma-70 family RNA polymerase sigma factor [Planctomycetia bacterium]